MMEPTSWKERALQAEETLDKIYSDSDHELFIQFQDWLKTRIDKAIQEHTNEYECHCHYPHG